MSRPSTSPVAHRSRRRLGQHFLEAAWVRRVVKLVDPEQHDVFLEIGAGRGALTLALAASGAQIIAVEMDRQLAAGLATRVPANVRVVARDFLALDVARLLEDAKGPVRVVGNVPYSVGAPILVKILRASDQGHRLADATLMLQHEVANRVTAEPGTADWGAAGHRHSASCRRATSAHDPAGCLPTDAQGHVRAHFPPLPSIAGWA